jgi:hypothetical protein
MFWGDDGKYDIVLHNEDVELLGPDTVG